MNMKILKKPKYLHTLKNVLMFALPVLVLVLCITIISLYKFDKKNFVDAMERETESILNTNEQADDMRSYTGEGAYRAEIKNVLLSFAEKNNTYETYAVIKNADGMIKASSKEALKGYFPYYDGPVFYCEEEEILNWYKENVYPLVSDLNHRYVYPTAYVIPEEVYVSQGKHQFIITNIHLMKAEIGEERYLIETEDMGYFDFGHLLDKKYGYEKVDTYTEIEIKIRGVANNSPVFERINEKGELKEVKKQLGDIVYYNDVPLADNTGTLTVYAYTNVLTDHASRYYMVVLVLTLLSILVVVAISWLIYVSGKSLYERETYRISLMNSLSHDLKTPLTAMSGYAENLLENIQSEKRDQYAHSIIENVEYMNSIIQNVVTLSKIESDCHDENKMELDLVKLSDELWQKYELRAQERNLSIELNGAYKVKANLTLMSIVIDNLLSNAIKYANDGSNIVISGTGSSYSIKNDMHGIIKNPKDLWSPFTKGDDSRSERNGSGLGLSIVKSILDQQKLNASINTDNNSFEVIIE